MTKDDRRSECRCQCSSYSPPVGIDRGAEHDQNVLTARWRERAPPQTPTSSLPFLCAPMSGISAPAPAASRTSLPRTALLHMSSLPLLVIVASSLLTHTVQAFVSPGLVLTRTTRSAGRMTQASAFTSAAEHQRHANDAYARRAKYPSLFYSITTATSHTALFSSHVSPDSYVQSVRDRPTPRRKKPNPSRSLSPTSASSFAVASSSSSALHMVMSIPEKGWPASSPDGADNVSHITTTASTIGNDYQQQQCPKKVRQKYQRKRIPETEQEHQRLRKERQAKYEQMRSNARGVPSIWSFENLFPHPVWDEDTIERDLYSIKRQDSTTKSKRNKNTASINSVKDNANANRIGVMFSTATSVIPTTTNPSTFQSRDKTKTPTIGGNFMMKVRRESEISSFVLPFVDDASDVKDLPSTEIVKEKIANQTKSVLADDVAVAATIKPASVAVLTPPKESGMSTIFSNLLAANAVKLDRNASKIDLQLTRMVEDRVYGYRRDDGMYATSLMGDGAVQFREGVRLGNPLPINAARLNYMAKKELRKGAVEEAKELYERAIAIDPRDGRAYLGLSRCAERRRDFQLAREILRSGIMNCVSIGPDGVPDKGANPFLLQALGCLEERSGHLSEAEALYIAAAKSRPSHAASWVALAQLRTRKFRQSASAGRVCYQNAERELELAGRPPSSHVYTAWASLEYEKAGDVRRARLLFQKALEVDPQCSAAWLQLGVMEMQNENWNEAKACFKKILTFDQHNSRALQAYAILETKRPGSDSRKAIDLFERALKANKRDGGVLQPYALYVASLGDVDGARELLRQGTLVNKRHAPLWQAWGVLETRHGNVADARNIFQQGIWACAQLGGGQSGGHGCARLWQAWGVLEAREGEHAAARRCFSRALDADNRNLAAITAWTLMEEGIGNLRDAELLFERALKQFVPGTDEKMRLWSLYETLQRRAGNTDAAQAIYQRSMRETFSMKDDLDDIGPVLVKAKRKPLSNGQSANGKSKLQDKEIEVLRWDDGSSSLKREVWIEGEVTPS